MFRVEAYFNDAKIEKTIITAKNSVGHTFFEHTGYYNDEAFISDELPEGTFVTCEAFPAAECQFSLWYYRIGGDDGELQSSNQNPFYYSGNETLIIRAEGKSVSETLPWYLTEADLGNVDENGVSVFDISFGKNQFRRYAYRFTDVGTAKISFYQAGAVEEICYFVTESYKGWNENTGRPSIVKLEEKSSARNFQIEYEVTEASVSVTHYIWIRRPTQINSQLSLYMWISLEPEIAPEPIMDKWDWQSSNGAATKEQTVLAYEAISNQRNTRQFSYLVWNDIVDKANELIVAYNLTWDGDDYATYYETKMSATGEHLTAKQFNALRNNIEIVGLHHAKLGYGTGIGVVVKDESIVFGEYFLTITDYINDCIDCL